MRLAQFIYMCASVLVFAVASMVGPLLVRADYDSNEILVVGLSRVIGEYHLVKVIRSDGTLWERSIFGTAGWIPATEYNGNELIPTPPVPIAVTQIAHFQYPFLVSKSGELWHYDVITGWTSYGVLPGGTIAVEKSTITDVKKAFREEED